MSVLNISKVDKAKNYGFQQEDRAGKDDNNPIPWIPTQENMKRKDEDRLKFNCNKKT